MTTESIRLWTAELRLGQEWPKYAVLAATVFVCAIVGVLLIRQSLDGTSAFQPPPIQATGQLQGVVQRLVQPSSAPARSLGVASVAAAPSLAAVGSASMTLIEGINIDEADNVRWALIRRTPAAADVYDGQRIDWAALRQIQAAGSILVPQGFVWSFNETFQKGPGYKEASGILAGGHCALATVFNGAAEAAGLPTTYRQHRTPYPGYAVEQCVNIYWGRDDLRVRNVADTDFAFRWELDSSGVTIHVVPQPLADQAPPPDITDATVAMVYGRPRSGSWGSLGSATIVDQALFKAFSYAQRIDGWNGERPVVAAVNPNILMAGTSALDDHYVYHLIAEAKRRNAYVMLDVQTGSLDPWTVFTGLMDRFMYDNVWFDWDLEHTDGGRAHAADVNRIAAEYFRRRDERGYGGTGVFAFYVFDMGAVYNAEQLQYTYPGGVMLPIFDGYGSANAKLTQTNRFLQTFGGGETGIMEFETRWGTKYDSISARDYFAAFPDSLLFVSQ